MYDKYHANSFQPPSLHNSITSALVCNVDGMVGFGVVSLYAEAIMILDLEKTKKDRLQALELLMTEAIRACREAEIGQLHVHVKDPKLIRLLKNKFNFEIVSDTVMVLGV